jgi:hypothetical protein
VTDLEPAEILRRARPIPTYRDHPATSPKDIVGVTPVGSPVVIGIAGSGGSTQPVLLLFLSSSCQGCQDLWNGTAALRQELPAGVRTVIVTRGAEQEDVSAVADLAPAVADLTPAVADLTPDGTEVVMSSAAYRDYRVAGPPFLVVVDRGEVRTEGVAWGVAETAQAVRAALEQGS